MNEYLFFIPIAITLGLGVISPGPSFIYVAQVALQKSRSLGIATAIGMGTGALLYALLAILGLFVILETVPLLYIALKIIGGLYLLSLAYKMWMSAKSDSNNVEKSVANTQDKPQTKQSTDKQDSLGKAYLLGLLTQLSNPKTAIVIGGIFMAFLPAQIPDYSIALLSLMAFVIDASWYVVVAIALTTSRAQRVYLRFKNNINRTAGALMGLLGLKLVFNQ